MNPADLRKLFEEANADCYADMRNTQPHPDGSLAYPDPPTPYDIDCGFCEQWAEYVRERLPGAEALWLDSLTRNRNVSEHGHVFIAHCVVRYRGKLYDAETFEGVKHWYQIPVYKNRNKRRTQVLKERDI